MEPNTDIARLQQLPETDPDNDQETGTNPNQTTVVRPYTSTTLHIAKPVAETDLDAEFVAEFGDGGATPQAGEAGETAKA